MYLEENPISDIQNKTYHSETINADFPLHWCPYLD